MISRIYTTILCSLFLFCGCEKQIDLGKKISGEKAFELIKKQIEFGRRVSNSSENLKCANWLKNQIDLLGLHGKVDSWSEMTDNGEMKFNNVFAELKGELPFKIIIGAHFDLKNLPNLPDFQGANDGGSGVAVILELMQVLKSRQEKNEKFPTIEFYFFDGEESLVRYTENDGLHGSKRVAKKIEENNAEKNYRAMILLDMVGDKDLFFRFPADTNHKLFNLVKNAATKIGHQNKITFDYELQILDDHIPFKNIGIPAINFIDFNYGPQNSFWHTPQDCIENVSQNSLQITGDIVLAFIIELAKQK